MKQFTSSSQVVQRRLSHAAASGLLLFCGLFASGSVLAARTFPVNSKQVKISAVADDAIVADGDKLHLSPGVVVFTPTNTTLVRSALPANVIVRIQPDLNGDVHRIWILADDEILVRPWWQFFLRSQPQSSK